MNDANSLLKELRIDRSQVPQTAPKRLGWMIGIVGLILLCIPLIWWLSTPRTLEVKTAMARISHVSTLASSVLDASGYITARRQATVSSKVTGKVVEVLVEEGMSVQEGQLLARLDDSNLRKELLLNESQWQAARMRMDEAVARLREAELNLQRRQELHARGLISQAELDTADVAYQALSAQLKTRQAEALSAERSVAVQKQYLEDLLIRAPFSGVVVAKNAQPGEMISPMSSGGFTRTGICSLVDMESLEIEVDVNEAYIDRVSAGQPVQAVLDAYADWKIPAKVAAIIPTADRQKATVKVRIAFDALDKRILPDMGVKVSFLATQEAVGEQAAEQGILVPVAAVREQAGEAFVFVLQDDHVQMRKLNMGAAINGYRPVKAGLQPGEYYVVEPPPELRDGMAVQVLN